MPIKRSTIMWIIAALVLAALIAITSARARKNQSSNQANVQSSPAATAVPDEEASPTPQSSSSVDIQINNGGDMKTQSESYNADGVKNNTKITAPDDAKVETDPKTGSTTVEGDGYSIRVNNSTNTSGSGTSSVDQNISVQSNTSQ